MECVCETRNLTKRFGDLVALDHIDLDIPRRSIIGLLGRNGSGKTTLIQHLVGLQLPSGGTVRTFGTATPKLDHSELARIGFVPQEIRLIDWMTVGQLLDYVACFYPRWDRALQQRLQGELELADHAVVGALSSGNLQKLAILTAVCHHPEFLVLDEPVSDLDPIVRGRFLAFLLELLREDETTILVSSHVLRDVEKVVDRIVCLDRGCVLTDAALDDLQERFGQWLVTPVEGYLPATFAEAWIVAQQGDSRQSKLWVREPDIGMQEFEDLHRVRVTRLPLSLEEIFPLLIAEREP